MRRVRNYSSLKPKQQKQRRLELKRSSRSPNSSLPQTPSIDHILLPVEGVEDGVELASSPDGSGVQEREAESTSSPIPIVVHSESMDASGTASAIEKHVPSKPQGKSAEDIIEFVLREWILKEKSVPDAAVTRLLHKFNCFYKITKTVSSLKGETICNVVYEDMHYGKFAYIEIWTVCLLKQIQAMELNSTSTPSINIVVNVDGIPLFEDNKNNHAYPILVSVLEAPHKIIFTGIYQSTLGHLPRSNNKLPPVDIFLHKFLRDLNNLIQEGLISHNSIIVAKLACFICDAPILNLT